MRSDRSGALRAGRSGTGSAARRPAASDSRASGAGRTHFSAWPSLPRGDARKRRQMNSGISRWKSRRRGWRRSAAPGMEPRVSTAELLAQLADHGFLRASRRARPCRRGTPIARRAPCPSAAALSSTRPSASTSAQAATSSRRLPARPSQPSAGLPVVIAIDFVEAQRAVKLGSRRSCRPRPAARPGGRRAAAPISAPK